MPNSSNNRTNKQNVKRAIATWNDCQCSREQYYIPLPTVPCPLLQLKSSAPDIPEERGAAMHGKG